MNPPPAKHPLPPNALSSFEHIRQLLHNKTPVVFLDYDGTLAPIVSRPDQAFMTETMRAAVKTVAQKFTTAVVSGRSTQKVVDFVQLDELFYAGSHGLDITGPHRSSTTKATGPVENTTDDTTTAPTTSAVPVSPPVKHRVAQTFVPVLKQCRLDLSSALDAALGHQSKVEIEDNVLTFSVHYRNAVGCTAKEVLQIINAVLVKPEYSQQLVCTAGKMVYEIRPRVQWNKGTAVLWLLDTLGMKGKEDVVALYVGDDVTDEDAFTALSEGAWQGRCASIVVQGENDRVWDEKTGGGEGSDGGGGGYMHRPTSALWSLKDTVEVEHFLMSLSQIGGEEEKKE